MRDALPLAGTIVTPRAVEAASGIRAASETPAVDLFA
jgi:hypothetical protein